MVRAAKTGMPTKGVSQLGLRPNPCSVLRNTMWHRYTQKDAFEKKPAVEARADGR